eukprot:224832-Chlamydomonas_euryale.AAC.1
MQGLAEGAQETIQFTLQTPLGAVYAPTPLPRAISGKGCLVHAIEQSGLPRRMWRCPSPQHFFKGWQDTDAGSGPAGSAWMQQRPPGGSDKATIRILTSCGSWIKRMFRNNACGAHTCMHVAARATRMRRVPGGCFPLVPLPNLQLPSAQHQDELLQAMVLLACRQCLRCPLPHAFPSTHAQKCTHPPHHQSLVLYSDGAVRVPAGCSDCRGGRRSCAERGAWGATDARTAGPAGASAAQVVQGAFVSCLNGLRPVYVLLKWFKPRLRAAACVCGGGGGESGRDCPRKARATVIVPGTMGRMKATCAGGGRRSSPCTALLGGALCNGSLGSKEGQGRGGDANGSAAPRRSL